MLKNKDNEYIELFNYSDYFEALEHTNTTATALLVIGTKHMAFRIKDIIKVKEFALANKLGENITINTGRLGRKYFFLKDPNSILVEIIEEGNTD